MFLRLLTDAFYYTKPHVLGYSEDPVAQNLKETYSLDSCGVSLRYTKLDNLQRLTWPHYES